MTRDESQWQQWQGGSWLVDDEEYDDWNEDEADWEEYEYEEEEYQGDERIDDGFTTGEETVQFRHAVKIADDRELEIHTASNLRKRREKSALKRKRLSMIGIPADDEDEG